MLCYLGLTEVGILSGGSYVIVVEARPTLSATKNVKPKIWFSAVCDLRWYCHRLLRRVMRLRDTLTPHLTAKIRLVQQSCHLFHSSFNDWLTDCIYECIHVGLCRARGEDSHALDALAGAHYRAKKIKFSLFVYMFVINNNSTQRWYCRPLPRAVYVVSTDRKGY